MIELVMRLLGEKPRAALLNEGKLTDYWELNHDSAYYPEAILLAKAGRVMKSLNAMFVTLPEGREGFLPFDEMPGDLKVKPGDKLLVQVKKPPTGDKAAFVSMDVRLPGRLSMLLPLGSAAHASRRAEQAAEMKALAQKLRPKGMGLVLRANAEGASPGEIQAEIEGLVKVWAEVSRAAGNKNAPALVRPAPGPLQRILRDLKDLPLRVVTDDEKAAQNLGFPILVSQDPFSLCGVEQQLYQALRRRVYLPSGGTLVLDPCEAALLIDVNTAQDTRQGGDVLLRTNLEAADEAARLLRLRCIGGIIMIDFIDMAEESSRQMVLQRLKNALKRDPAVTEVFGFTRLGLVEMTRKRGDTPLKAECLTQDPGNAWLQENSEDTDA
jgi:Rne/Rng family ribonuclease